MWHIVSARIITYNIFGTLKNPFYQAVQIDQGEEGGFP